MIACSDAIRYMHLGSGERIVIESEHLGKTGDAVEEGIGELPTEIAIFASTKSRCWRGVKVIVPD
jgi:hypothetical protein